MTPRELEIRALKVRVATLEDTVNALNERLSELALLLVEPEESGFRLPAGEHVSQTPY